MGFQSIVDSYTMAAVVISVRTLPNGHYDEIRLVAANSIYKKDMTAFKDNMLYSDLIPKEPNFEDFCYRCAVEKKFLHAYVKTKSMGIWVDSTYIPLSSEYDTDNLHHFLFLHEFTTDYIPEKMSDVSLQTSQSVIKTCINLRGSNNYYESMNTVIEDIQKETDSFCSCIILIDKQKKHFAPLCAKYKDDVATIEDFAEYLTPEVVFSWEDTISKRDMVIIKDDFDMDELEKINPVWVKSLRGAEVKNLILVPLSQGKKMFGVLFITNFNTENIVKIKEYIDLTSFFLSSEISNNDLMEKLEYLSNVDSLTEVKNRNSMNTRIDWHVKQYSTIPVPFGVIFADLNGLKKCNDTGGHEAGDQLLINAAKLLKKHFGEYEIYRSGGDEFVVIAPGLEKEAFNQKVEELRDESGYDAEVSLALGSDWTTDAKNLRKCLHNADEAMYRDKEEFYKKHPDKARA